MKILAALPNQNHFTPIKRTSAWPYIWELLQAPKLRVYSKTAHPWGGTPQAIEVREGNRIDLMCQPVSADDITSHTPSFLILEFQQGGIPHSKQETLAFYPIPCRMTDQFAMLSIVKS